MTRTKYHYQMTHSYNDGGKFTQDCENHADMLVCIKEAKENGAVKIIVNINKQ